MDCPCKGCEKAGCGSYHDQCEPYQEWKKNRDKTNQWLSNQLPIISENAVKGMHRKIRSKARGWPSRKGGKSE